MIECSYCKKKIASSKVFCSKSCKENYFQLISIQVPKLFLKRLFIFCTKEEREQLVMEFSQRHKYRLDLLRTKIEDEAAKIGYID